jgi:hypothetical protein
MKWKLIRECKNYFAYHDYFGNACKVKSHEEELNYLKYTSWVVALSVKLLMQFKLQSFLCHIIFMHPLERKLCLDSCVQFSLVTLLALTFIVQE